MAQIESLRVLLVDDSPATRALIRGKLVRLGISRVHEAISADEAMSVLQADPSISLVMLDWEMPTMSQLDFVKSLRETDAYQDIYVIMLCSYFDEKDVLKALSAGVNDYLLKPFNSTTFQQRVTRMLGGSGHVYSRRFGEYLLRKGLIDKKQLAVALECQKRLDVSRFSIGSIAIISGICSPRQVVERLRETLNIKSHGSLTPAKLMETQEFWGTIISHDQIEQIVELMAQRRLMIGEIMSGFGFVSPEILQRELDEFLAMQS